MVPSTDTMPREGSFALASVGRVRKVQEPACAVAAGWRSFALNRIVDAVLAILPDAIDGNFGRGAVHSLNDTILDSMLLRQARLTTKLSDPAHEGVRLQPERDGRVRCSAWLGIRLSSFRSVKGNPNDEVG